jgi:hypothetical protein
VAGFPKRRRRRWRLRRPQVTLLMRYV